MIKNKYGIKTKPASPGNLQAITIIEIIHEVIGNLVRTCNIQETYVDDADLWMGIIAAAYFAVRSTYHTTKGKSPGQLFFGRDMILPINHEAGWRYIFLHKKAEIDKYFICENTTIIDHDYRVGDKVTTKNKSEYK